MFERFTGRKKKPPVLTGDDYFNSDEYVRNQAIFDQFNAELNAQRAARVADPTLAPELDSETRAVLEARANEYLTPEKQKWTYDADHWYDGDGNILLSRRDDGWYDPAGVRLYDLNYGHAIPRDEGAR
ncbi:hypothetical protein ACFWPH_32015 [Nocardia sp. NPDC058499]|uniref:hypothetical protein n=1 Tax=Nocardia sp. NPDC058499 TaxID=3346530 RepID=UPI0036673908